MCLDIGRAAAAGRASDREQEAARLVESAGADVVEVLRGRRDRPDSKTFAGTGKIEEIGDAVRLHGAHTVVFDHALSASQVRNVERALAEGGQAVRVYDRTELILEIFGQRARSHEGKLQVELARLEHHATRLVRGWSHLERQRGGLGKTGGPGEKQIELDRRMIGEEVKKLKARIAKVTQDRATQRSGRARAGVLRVSLVGYTNAGKSTLFNRLTGADAYVADQLFATLDTTTRKLWLANDSSAAISDTVGFIQDLPHSLVAAFRATLDEAVQADVLLHVVDSASPSRDEQIAAVNKVLKEIGAANVPQILVWNQIDRVPGLQPEVIRDPCGKILNIKVSAVTGAGLELIRGALLEMAGATPTDAQPCAA
ncbi:GTPase HflX [Usitatibacter palustris]|uniref:GTPase HflX n=1 Tax=Usitatibacter palustris TaxID=2732487 RepID=A0A6M4HCH0_9PROT|nr:GTPase HflX [Usitatibacter palustris]QJR15697.1 GTPase HflX [Usitatibacter palustris]